MSTSSEVSLTETTGGRYKKTKQSTTLDKGLLEWSTPLEQGSKPEKKKAKLTNKQKISRKDSAEFYSSYEWKKLRWRMLNKYKCSCMMCGRSPELHNVPLEVTHIIPRSKNRKLSLEFDNLQILCEDCSEGGGRSRGVDYRPQRFNLTSAEVDTAKAIGMSEDDFSSLSPKEREQLTPKENIAYHAAQNR
jgi:5-methylcytosine-specific restriction endonuclease McrA